MMRALTRIASLSLASGIACNAMAQSPTDTASALPGGVQKLQAWDAGNPHHQSALHSFLADDDAFQRLSDGKISRMSPGADGMLRAKLAQQGIKLGPAESKVLTEHLILVASGRHPRKLQPARLVRPYAHGSRGLHGFLAESVLMSSDESLHFSRNNSISSDYTRRGGDGAVKAHGQVKCHSTLGRSRNGIIDSFIKFNRTAYHADSGKPFEGVIPKDQFDEMRMAGEIDDQGRVVDRDGLRRRITERVEWARSSPNVGSTNRAAMIEGGARLAGASDTELDRLRFKPHPLEHAELVKRTNDLQAKSHSSSSPLSVPPDEGPMASSPPRMSRSGGLTALMVALAISDVGSLGTRGLGSVRAVDVLAAGQSMLEPASQLNGSHKRAVQRLMKHLPKGLRMKLPPIERLRMVGRFAGRYGGPLVMAAILLYETYQFASGASSSRTYVESVSAMATGAAGWVVGAMIGGKLGSIVPIVGNVAGALIGGFVGAYIGASVGQALSDSVFDKLDEADLQLYIAAYKEQLRQAALVPVR